MWSSAQLPILIDGKEVSCDARVMRNAKGVIDRMIVTNAIEGLNLKIDFAEHFACVKTNLFPGNVCRMYVHHGKIVCTVEGRYHVACSIELYLSHLVFKENQ